MGAIANVTLRGSTYHFRRVVPAELRRVIRRRELTLSLRTSDLRTAKLQASRLYVASERIFAAANVRPMLSDTELARLVQDFYATILKRENDVRLASGYMTDEVRARRQTYYAEVATRSQDALACNRLDEAAFITEALLRKHGRKPSELGPGEFAQAKQAMLRAGIDVANSLKARYEGDFNHKPADDLLTMTMATMEPGPLEPRDAPLTNTPAAEEGTASEQNRRPDANLSAIAPIFCDEQVSIRAWERQTAAQAGATFRLFVAVCGDRPIAAYSRRDVGDFRQLIQRLPFNYSKAANYRNMTPSEIVALFEAEGSRSTSPAMAQKTVKRHFSAMSALWASALPRGDVSENIFTGFRFANSKKAVDQREMWSRDDLRRLFSSPVWTGSASQSRRSAPGPHVIKDPKFWLPLIAVFSGMRQEEICQLQVEDIRTDGQITFFDINDRAPRMLKNANAVRQVPIHQELIRLGLLTFVEDLRGSQRQIFAELKGGGADGRLGHAYTKWFTRYRRDIGLYRPGLDFHSLRHSATTWMHQADVARAVIDHVTGHATPGETSRYTKKSMLTQLASAIERIDIGVDLSALHVAAMPVMKSVAPEDVGPAPCSGKTR